jgi:hypothetical protein
MPATAGRSAWVAASEVLVAVLRSHCQTDMETVRQKGAKP